MYYYEHYIKGECKIEADTDESALVKIKDIEGADMIGVSIVWCEPASNSDPTTRTLWME